MRRADKCHTFLEEEMLLRLLDAFSVASGTVLLRHATETED